MSPIRAAAGAMMRAAQWLTPPNMVEWLRGMSAEYQMLPNDGAALSWASGCVVTALGLRLRAEALYFIVVTAALVGWRFWLAPFFWIAENLSSDVGIVVGLGQASLAFLLVVYRPRRALISAFLASLASMGGVMLWWLLSHRGIFAPLEIWLYIGRRVLTFGWAAYPGALAGWAYVRYMRRRSPV